MSRNAHLNPRVLPSGVVQRLYEAEVSRGGTPPVHIVNPDTPFFDPTNHEFPQSNSAMQATNDMSFSGGWTGRPRPLCCFQSWSPMPATPARCTAARPVAVTAVDHSSALHAAAEATLAGPWGKQKPVKGDIRGAKHLLEGRGHHGACHPPAPAPRSGAPAHTAHAERTAPPHHSPTTRPPARARACRGASPQRAAAAAQSPPRSRSRTTPPRPSTSTSP